MNKSPRLIELSPSAGSEAKQTRRGTSGGARAARCSGSSARSSCTCRARLAAPRAQTLAAAPGGLGNTWPWPRPCLASPGPSPQVGEPQRAPLTGTANLKPEKHAGAPVNHGTAPPSVLTHATSGRVARKPLAAFGETVLTVHVWPNDATRTTKHGGTGSWRGGVGRGVSHLLPCV